MKNKIFFCFFIVGMLLFGACQRKEEIEIKPFEATTDLFFYEGTEDVDVIAVDEEGYLYTATCITEIKEGDMIDENTYQPFIQQFKVYDLEGNCVKEVEVAVGNGDINFLTAKGEVLYCIVMKSDLASYMPTLYTIHTKTWEVTEVCGFEDYILISNFVEIEDYFYVIGTLKEPEEKTYELHPNVISYTYLGEAVGRVKVGEESSDKEVELLSVDFPIDIVGTKDNTILIYHYSEENGFGFLEFHPKEESLEVVGWKESNVPDSFFTMCEKGFLFYKERGIFFGVAEGVEGKISSKDIFVKDAPTYQRGFLFYMNVLGGCVERIGVADLIKENTPIHLLMHDENMAYTPYDSGYQVKKIVLEEEQYALKVLAQDSDMDMYLLNSRSFVSYNLKEKGAFYALNEVEGVQEYLDACFPYIKEIAQNEEGDIWMIPIGIAVPTLMYHREYCELEETDLSQMNFQQFLSFIEQIETENPNQGSISLLAVIEELFKQYLSVYESFDTDIFRVYASQIRTLYEKCGRFVSDLPTKIVQVKFKLDLDEETYLTPEELAQVAPFFYEYNLYSSSLFSYSDRLGNSDLVGVTGVPKITEEIGNVGLLTFLAVNPKSENLDVALAYISDFCKYMITQKDTFLLDDISMYTDIPFIKECYEVYKDGTVFFHMDGEVYWNLFWDYVEGKLELEEMITEIERRRLVYMGE